MSELALIQNSKIFKNKKRLFRPFSQVLMANHFFLEVLLASFGGLRRQNGEPKPFTSHSIELNPGDTLYTFSDGFADQFGGEKGKKFKKINFKKLLLSIEEKSMQEQSQIIQETFNKWKGNLEQIDDVCVMGVRV